MLSFKKMLMILAANLALTVSVQADEIRMAFGLSVPPYIIQENDTGIEREIIEEALSYKGHTMKVVYIPFIEIVNVFSKDIADAAATVEEKIGIDGNFSDHVITYENYVMTLDDNGYEIDSVWDLKDYSISAFQLARKYMGKEFAQMAHANPRYRERKKQEAHVRLLYQDRVQAIVTDKNIFKYYANKLEGKIDSSKKIKYHQIFPFNKYKVVFRSAKVRDDFNEGIKHIKSTGRYQQIFDKYLQQ